MSGGYIALIVIASLIVIFFIVIFSLLPVKSYFTALFSKCHISARKLITMRFRKLPVFDMVNAYITARTGNAGISLAEIENMHATDCDYNKFIQGLIACKNAGVNIDYNTYKKVYLSGKDILDFVQECLNSKVVETNFITAMCADLQEINSKIKITLKVNMKNLLSTLNEETILARINESVFSFISSTKDHKTILQAPQLLAKAIYDAEVDSGNFYEVVSADVMEINLGNNIALRKEKELIEKNRVLEQNRLEARRLTAVAVEQEMKARTEEMKAKLVEKEMEVPAALTEAVKEGKIDKLIDYYKLQNIQADTEMRRRLGGKFTHPENKNFDDDFDDDE